MPHEYLKLLFWVPVTFIVSCIPPWILDYYVWNHGVCRKNGMPWVYFDTDSQGGRGYKALGETCWISWPFIDTVKSKEKS